MDIQLAALTLAAHLQIDSDQLLTYMREGEALNIGGYHYRAELARAADGSQWPSGSIFAVEGAILYALVRYFKFSVVAEIGGFWGCSSSWMAAAIAANIKNQTQAFDITPPPVVYSVDSGALGAQHGAKISTDLRPYVNLVNGDGEKWLNQQPNQSLQLIFEDADHGSETSKRLALAALPKIVNGGLYIVHDAQHDHAYLGDGSTIDVAEGKAIREGLDAAKLDYRLYLVEPSDCGFAIAKVKHEDAPEITYDLANDLAGEPTSSEPVDVVPEGAGDNWQAMTAEARPDIETHFSFEDEKPAPKKTRKPRTPKVKSK